MIHFITLQLDLPERCIINKEDVMHERNQE